MAEDKMIKTFLLAENIMCVYRNYVSFSGYKKILILIRITLEIIWMLITILIFVWQVSEQFSTRNHFLYLMGVYHLTNALCGIALVICGVQYSESYKLFLTNFEVIRHEFQNSSAYTKNIKKLKRNLTILIVFFAFVSIIDFFFKLRANMITWRQNHIKITFLTLLFTLVYIEIRKILVNSIHYANITILRSTLESLTDRVSEIREKLSKPRMSDRSYKLTVAQVDEWAANYQKVLISSKLLSECAGCQMFSSLTMSSVNYVISLYGMWYSILMGFKTGCMMTGYIMTYSLFCTYAIIIAGQNLLNQSNKMKREFSKLYNMFSAAHQSPETKCLRNLNLLARTNPIQIKYTNKLPLGMYLIPTILSLCATYVIVALQFNHII